MEDNLYINSKEFFSFFKADILKIPGIKHEKIGYINDNEKLIIESLIR